MNFKLLIVLGTLLIPFSHSAHQQWVKLSISNNVEPDQELYLALSDFGLKWGHFYDCKDEKRRKIEMPKNHPILIESGSTLQICATGAKMAPSGVEGEMLMMGFIKNTENTEWSTGSATYGERLIFKAGIYFDSPFVREKNRFNYTIAKDSTPKIRLWCKDDFNKRGGALGNVDCYVEGTFREKQKALPISENEE
jgi:Aegerolysin